MIKVMISWELDQKRNSDIEKWSAIQAFHCPKHDIICPDLHSEGVNASCQKSEHQSADFEQSELTDF